MLRPASAFGLGIYDQYDSPKLDQFLREHVDGYTMHCCINFDDRNVIFCVVTQNWRLVTVDMVATNGNKAWWRLLVVLEPGKMKRGGGLAVDIAVYAIFETDV